MKQAHRCAASALAGVAALALSACTTLAPQPDQPLYAEPAGV